jgi:hypothetical protein
MHKNYSSQPVNLTTRRMIFTTLDEDILITVVSQWLSIEDIPALDSALCNRKLRESYLRWRKMVNCVMRHGRPILKNESFRTSSNEANFSKLAKLSNWISSRNIFIKSIHIPVLPHSLFHQVCRRFSSVQSLALSRNVNYQSELHFSILLQNLPCLKELYFHKIICSTTFFNLGTTQTTAQESFQSPLEKFYLAFSTVHINTFYTLIHFLSQHCPRLTTLQLSSLKASSLHIITNHILHHLPSIQDLTIEITVLLDDEMDLPEQVTPTPFGLIEPTTSPTKHHPLQHLSIFQLDTLDRRFFHNLFFFGTTLRTLKLTLESSASAIVTESFTQHQQHDSSSHRNTLSQLTKCHLEGFGNDIMVYWLLLHSNQLQHLHLINTDITNKTLSRIPSSFPALLTLELMENRLVTDHGLCSLTNYATSSTTTSSVQCGMADGIESSTLHLTAFIFRTRILGEENNTDGKPSSKGINCILKAFAHSLQHIAIYLQESRSLENILRIWSYLLLDYPHPEKLLSLEFHSLRYYPTSRSQLVLHHDTLYNTNQFRDIKWWRFLSLQKLSLQKFWLPKEVLISILQQCAHLLSVDIFIYFIPEMGSLKDINFGEGIGRKVSGSTEIKELIEYLVQY